MISSKQCGRPLFNKLLHLHTESAMTLLLPLLAIKHMQASSLSNSLFSILHVLLLPAEDCGNAAAHGCMNRATERDLSPCAAAMRNGNDYCNQHAFVDHYKCSTGGAAKEGGRTDGGLPAAAASLVHFTVNPVATMPLVERLAKRHCP
jgi:hypothetical protein